LQELRGPEGLKVTQVLREVQVHKALKEIME
jgi:hypothetical protein